MRNSQFSALDRIPEPVRFFLGNRLAELAGAFLLLLATASALALASWSVQDPSLNHATDGHVRNMLGQIGAIAADISMQIAGLGSIAMLIPPFFWGWSLVSDRTLRKIGLSASLWILGILSSSIFASTLPTTNKWPLHTGLGGVIGDALVSLPGGIFGEPQPHYAIMVVSAAVAVVCLAASSGCIPEWFCRYFTGSH